ncbi:MAG: hypothetical protein ACTSU2_14505 [Promethearchaeota archaeon]
MKLVSDRVYHKHKKFKCPNCGFVRMQKQKKKEKRRKNKRVEF